MGNLKISVIIPVYNAEKYLRECLNSILMGQYSDWECILVDDGSEDGSLSICKEYVTKDKRFKYFHQKNAGASAARNVGLDNAKGEYITFIDADDWVSSNYLFAVDKCDSDLILLETKHVNNEGRIIRYFSIEPQVSSCREDFVSIVSQNMTHPLMRMMTAKIVRRSCISNIRFNVEMKVGEDTLFWYDVLCNCNGIGTLQGYTYFWRDNGGDVTKYPLTPSVAAEHASKMYQSYRRSGFACDDVELFIINFFFMLAGGRGNGIAYFRRWFVHPDVKRMNTFLLRNYPDKLSDYYRFYMKPVYIQYFLSWKYCISCFIRRVLH